MGGECFLAGNFAALLRRSTVDVPTRVMDSDSDGVPGLRTVSSDEEGAALFFGPFAAPSLKERCHCSRTAL